MFDASIIEEMGPLVAKLEETHGDAIELTTVYTREEYDQIEEKYVFQVICHCMNPSLIQDVLED